MSRCRCRKGVHQSDQLSGSYYITAVPIAVNITWVQQCICCLLFSLSSSVLCLISLHTPSALASCGRPSLPQLMSELPALCLNSSSHYLLTKACRISFNEHIYHNHCLLTNCSSSVASLPCQFFSASCLSLRLLHPPSSFSQTPLHLWHPSICPVKSSFYSP